MREAKFRGQNKKFCMWAYGYYVQIGDTHWIAERDVEFRTADIDEASYGEQPETGIYGMTQVLPETVGEYTGLKDKNGVEIYEGDICDWCSGRVIDYVELKDNDGWKMRDLYNINWWEDAKVIGNIHENPELLKGD